jgi:hypothetical protein
MKLLQAVLLIALAYACFTLPELVAQVSLYFAGLMSDYIGQQFSEAVQQTNP